MIWFMCLHPAFSERQGLAVFIPASQIFGQLLYCAGASVFAGVSREREQRGAPIIRAPKPVLSSLELRHRLNPTSALGRDGSKMKEPAPIKFRIESADWEIHTSFAMPEPSARIQVLTREAIAAGSDEKVFQLLGNELARRLPEGRQAPDFPAQIQMLPVGLKAMAATYELDVSLALDDLGWHFGNWHDKSLAEETTRGLKELNAAELAAIFQEAFQLALQYWNELEAEDWEEWYPESALAAALDPLNDRAWQILDGKKNGLFDYWVDYARRKPEGLGLVSSKTMAQE